MAVPTNMEEFKPKFRQVRDELNHWLNTEKKDLDVDNYNDIKGFNKAKLLAIGATEVDADFYAEKIVVVKNFVTNGYPLYGEFRSSLEETVRNLP